MAEVACRCGRVRGRVTGVSPQSVNRVICYCDDCQAFAHHLKRADLLDPHGGSDIVQLAPAALTFQSGHECIAGVRLKPKGLYRWYATCCHTPLGNTVSPAIPFVGAMTEAFQSNGQSPDQMFGAPIGAIMGRYAVGEPPPGSDRFNLPLMARAIIKVAGWRLSGKTWPHPYFERSTGKPIYTVTTLSVEGRDALRPLCGPKPTKQTDLHQS